MREIIVDLLDLHGSCQRVIILRPCPALDPALSPRHAESGRVTAKHSPASSSQPQLEPTTSGRALSTGVPPDLPASDRWVGTRVVRFGRRVGCGADFFDKYMRCVLGARPCTSCEAGREPHV